MTEPWCQKTHQADETTNHGLDGNEAVVVLLGGIKLVGTYCLNMKSRDKMPS